MRIHALASVSLLLVGSFASFALGGCASDDAGERSDSAESIRASAPTVELPWTEDFEASALLLADEIVIEGPPGLIGHVAVRQNPQWFDYEIKTVAEGLLQVTTPKLGGPGEPVAAQLDGLKLFAVVRLRILERPNEIPVTVHARGEALWQDEQSGAQRRENEIVLTGRRPQR